MKVSRYEIFLKAVQTQSLTKTAEYYSYTQSAVSQLIKALENELGITLFERKSQGVSLTREGEAVLPAVREIVMGERQLANCVAELRDLQVGTIYVAAYTSILCHWLPPKLKRFMQQYPNIHFELLQGDYEEVVECVHTGRADIGLMIRPFEKDLLFQQLLTDKMQVVVPEYHRIARMDEISLKEAKGEPFILLESGYKQIISRMAADAKIELQTEFLVNDDDTVMSMVENGLGISILPELVLCRSPYGIRAVDTAPAYYRELGIVTYKHKKMTWAVKRFCQYLLGGSETNLKKSPG